MNLPSPNSSRRHSFNRQDREKSAKTRRESPKTIHFAEAKRLVCERLRSAKTDAQSFVKLLEIYLTRFHKLSRGKNSAEIHDIVRSLEAKRGQNG